MSREDINAISLTKWLAGIIAALIVVWAGALTKQAFGQDARIARSEQELTDIQRYVVPRLDKIDEKLDAILQKSP